MIFLAEYVIFRVLPESAYQGIIVSKDFASQKAFDAYYDIFHIINAFCPGKNSPSVWVIHAKNQPRAHFFVEKLHECLLFFFIQLLKIEHDTGSKIAELAHVKNRVIAPDDAGFLEFIDAIGNDFFARPKLPGKAR